MKIPKKIRIGVHTYKIKFVETDKLGETNRATNTITLAKGLPKDQLEATLFHEIFHAINNELDHALLDSLSEQFYQVMTENKFI